MHSSVKKGERGDRDESIGRVSFSIVVEERFGNL